jgi:AcrR family transcriptional regulator
MSSSPPGSRRRPRQARAIAHDQRIRDAAERLLAAEGWGAFSRRAIARHAGTSEQVVRDRVDTAEGFAVTLWRERYGPHAIAELQALLRAHRLLDGEPTRNLPEVWHPFIEPTPTWQATMEILFASNFYEPLRASVDHDLGAALRTWTDPQRDPHSATLAAQRAFTLIRALGFLTLAPHRQLSNREFDLFAFDYHQHLQHPTPVTPLPELRAEHLDHILPFDSGDPQQNATLQATFEIVSEIGFERATLATIVERAGIDNNYIYRHYPSKTHLFMDATLRQRRISMRLNDAFKTEQAARHGAGLAENLLMREFMRPERHHIHRCELEQWRLSWHHPDLRQAMNEEIREPVAQLTAAYPLIPQSVIRAGVHTGRATGIGAVLFASINPGCEELPYHVITNNFFPTAPSESHEPTPPNEG